MQHQHIVVDIETLGVSDANTTILSIAAVPFRFGEVTPYCELLKQGFYRKLNAADQLKRGRSKEQSTIDWWKQQPPEAQKNGFMPSSEDVTIDQALRELKQWVQTTDYDFRNSWIWCRGLDFDKPKIDKSYNFIGVETPFNTWRWRDIRTMIDCLTGSTNGKYILEKEPDEFIPHHCLHDAAHDVAVMQEIYSMLES